MIDDFTEAFLQAAASGELLVQVCNDCAAVNSYATTDVCHRCGGVDLVTTRSAGRGAVVSMTRVHRPADGYGERTVILVELDEGVRVLGLADATSPVAISDRVVFLHSWAPTGALVFRRDVETLAEQSTGDKVLDSVPAL